MQLKTKDGISCDLCYAEYKDNFIYYSVDCSKVSVNVPRRFTTKAIPYKDFDLCELCWGKMSDCILKHSQPETLTIIICDNCGIKMKNVFDYCHVRVHRVPVNKTTYIDGHFPTGIDLDLVECKYCMDCVGKMNEKKNARSV